MLGNWVSNFHLTSSQTWGRKQAKTRVIPHPIGRLRICLTHRKLSTWNRLTGIFFFHSWFVVRIFAWWLMVSVTTRDQISISFLEWGVSQILSIGSRLNYQLYLSHSCVLRSYVIGRWVSFNCLKLHYNPYLIYISILPVFPRKTKEVMCVYTCSQLHPSVVFCNMESWLEYPPRKQSHAKALMCRELHLEPPFCPQSAEGCLPLILLYCCSSDFSPDVAEWWNFTAATQKMGCDGIWIAGTPGAGVS